MTAREARTERRAAERQQKKMAASQPACEVNPNAEVPQSAETPSLHRTEINRLNAQHSTGPKTPEGKANSARNSFKHGLYSKQLIIPGEDPAELDALRANLRAEHQPANTTEDILVNELAEHFWRLRRMRELEARAWQPENLDGWCDNGLLALIQRSMASAERSFHKSLAALSKLQKARGFVPSERVPEQESVAPPHQEDGFVSSEWVEDTEPDSEFVWLTVPEGGFVPANQDATANETAHAHQDTPAHPNSISDLLLAEDDEEPGNWSPAAA